MAEKVKVSREVAEAIEWGISRGAADTFLVEHGNNWKNGGFADYRPSHEELRALSKISVFQLAEILLNGYETEQTPAEKIAATFLKNKRKCEESDEPHEVEWERGFNSGIQYTLGILEIKIPGINK